LLSFCCEAPTVANTLLIQTYLLISNINIKISPQEFPLDNPVYWYHGKLTLAPPHPQQEYDTKESYFLSKYPLHPIHEFSPANPM
jgi:hypothetical protein